MKRGLHTRITWLLAALFVLGSVGFMTQLGDRYFEIAKNMDVFARTYKEINAQYADEVDPTRLMQVALDSMLMTLDPYTNYLTESRIEEAKVMQTGQYSSVGMEIRQIKDEIVVVEVQRAGPADKGGVQVGDRIRQIDGEVVDTGTMRMADIQALLQGEFGSSLTLEIERLGEAQSQTYTLSRDQRSGQQQMVPFYGTVSEHIGYAKLIAFDATAAEEVRDALKELKKTQPELKGMILDLRGNPGGRVDQAIGVVNVFIAAGEKIVEIRGRDAEKPERFGTRNKPVDTDIPLAILINRGSASASEIVAGAVQDLDRGVVVGQRSFGKGLVQNVRPLSFNTQLKITIAKYYIPSGRCIQALDYAHRNEDGSVNYIPDSLIQTFKTRNGRTVYDGGGVDPDVPVSKDEYTAVISALRSQGILIDFVNKYCKGIDSLSVEPAAYQLEAGVFDQFIAFAQERGFEYKAAYDPVWEQFQAEMKTDPRWVGKYDTDLEKLQEELGALKQAELTKYQKVLEKILRHEIIRRYYYQEGVIKASFTDDPDVLAAIEILERPAQYRALLK